MPTSKPHKHPLFEDVYDAVHPGTKCVPALIDKYCELAKKGWSRNRISKALDIKYDTLCKWEEWGREPGAPKDGIYTIFAKRIAVAHEYVVDKALERVTGDVDNVESFSSVKTAQWLLERKLPEEFAPPKQRIENTTAITIDVFQHMSTAEVMRELKIENALSIGDGAEDADFEELDSDGEPQDT